MSSPTSPTPPAPLPVASSGDPQSLSRLDRFCLSLGAILFMALGGISILIAIGATAPFINLSFGSLAPTSHPGAHIAFMILGWLLGVFCIFMAIGTKRHRRSVAKLAPALSLLLIFTAPLTAKLIDLLQPQEQPTGISALTGISYSSWDLYSPFAWIQVLSQLFLGGILTWLYLRPGTQLALTKPLARTSRLDQLPIHRLFLALCTAIALIADLVVLTGQTHLGETRFDLPWIDAFPYLSLAIGLLLIVMNLRNSRWAWLPATAFCGGWLFRLFFANARAIDAHSLYATLFSPQVELISMMAIGYLLLWTMHFWFSRRSTDSLIPIRPATPNVPAPTSPLAVLPMDAQEEPLTAMPLSYAGNAAINSSAGLWLTRWCAILWIALCLPEAYSALLFLKSYLWVISQLDPSITFGNDPLLITSHSSLSRLPQLIMIMALPMVFATLGAGMLLRRRWAAPVGFAVALSMLILMGIVTPISLLNLFQSPFFTGTSTFWVQSIGLSVLFILAWALLTWISHKPQVRSHLELRDPISTPLDRLSQAPITLAVWMIGLGAFAFLGSAISSPLLYAPVGWDGALPMTLNVLLGLICLAAAGLILRNHRLGQTLGLLACVGWFLHIFRFLHRNMPNQDQSADLIVVGMIVTVSAFLLIFRLHHNKSCGS